MEKWGRQDWEKAVGDRSTYHKDKSKRRWLQPREANWMWSWSGKAGEKRKEKSRLIDELRKELKDARRQNNVNVQIVEDLTAAVEEQAQEIARLRERCNMQEVKMKILVDMWAMRFLDEQYEDARTPSQE